MTMINHQLSAAEAAEHYFAAWQEKDLQRLRPQLHPDVTFRGPLGQTDGVDDTIAGLTGLAGVTTSLTVVKRLADESDVMTWFELGISGCAPTATVNWTQLDEGLITAIRVTFDPRAVLAAG